MGNEGTGSGELSGAMETLDLAYGGGHAASYSQKSFYSTPGEGGFIVNYTSTNLTFPRKEEEKDDNQT